MRTKKTTKAKKTVKKHKKQHSLRGATFTRIASKLEVRADAVLNEDDTDLINRAAHKALSELAAIFRQSGQSERKLR